MFRIEMLARVGIGIPVYSIFRLRLHRRDMAIDRRIYESWIL